MIQTKKIIALTVITFYVLTLTNCKKTFENPLDNPVSKTLLLPTVSTNPSNLQNPTTCLSGGNVTANGGDSVTERGVCYNNQPLPTINNFKIISGSGNGSYTTEISNLLPNSQYYIRAYAINSVGIAYGQQMVVQTQPIDSAKTLYIPGGNKLYSFSFSSNPIPGNRKELTLNWSATLGAKATSSPIYWNGYIFIGCRDSYLYAFDTLGTLKWRYNTGGSIDRFSPVVSGGVVFINNNNTVFAFDCITGVLKWRYDTNYNSSYQSGVSVANNTVYLSANLIYAINAETGNLRWSKYLNQTILLPKIFNNKLYTTSGGTYRFKILNASTGDEILSTNDYYWGTAQALAINIAKGNVYLQTENNIIALDTLTGAFKWNGTVQGGYSLDHQGGSHPVVSDSIVITVDASGRSTFRNSITGRVITDGGGQIVDGDVTVVNNFVCYGTRDIYNLGLGYVIAAELPYRGFGWQATIRDDFAGTPCIVTKLGKIYRAGDIY